MQLCASGFKASLSFKNEDIGVSVNLSADLGRIESPAFAFNDMMTKKNLTTSQLRHKAAWSKEENAVCVAPEYALSGCERSMEPPPLIGNISADDLLISA